MKKERTRQEMLDDGQTYTGFEFKGRKHKPLTGGALKFLQRIGSPLFTNEANGRTEIDIVIEYLFATSATIKELCDSVDNWEQISYQFADQYTVKELTDPIIMESIIRDIQNQTGASIEVESGDDKKKSEIVPIG